MKLTKMDMAKVIVTALYNLNELVTEKNYIAWKHAKNLTRLKKEHLVGDYTKAVNILNNRTSDEKIESAETDKETVIVKIEYDIIVDDIVNQYPKDIIELWQKHNFHNGLADAHSPTHTFKKENDILIKVMDDGKIIQTIAVIGEK